MVRRVGLDGVDARGTAMFFLTRSALCIGLVALAASDAGGADALRAAVGDGARGAATTLGRACLGSSECLRAGTLVVAAAAPSGPQDPRRDTGRALGTLASGPAMADMGKATDTPPHAQRRRDHLQLRDPGRAR